MTSNCARRSSVMRTAKVRTGLGAAGRPAAGVFSLMVSLLIGSGRRILTGLFLGSRLPTGSEHDYGPIRTGVNLLIAMLRILRQPPPRRISRYPLGFRLSHIEQEGGPPLAKRTIVTLVDDIDGSEAAETVSFSVEGVDYEIDLSAANATALRNVLQPFAAAARRTNRRKAARRTGTARQPKTRS
ncbi:Lsr2 family protein [Agromyces tropicus]|uniref:histone-like nucleoid-structuring protein Lsr2 n=1 Tax=Agromyces tropicus TaxID=555371 RepID=UPI0031D96D5E